MQGIQQRNETPVKNPAMLLELSPDFHWDPSHFLCSHCLLLTAGERRVNGTKHRQGLKYQINYAHIETWNSKQHNNANKTTIHTRAKPNKNNNWPRSLFLHIFKIHSSGKLWTLQDIMKSLGCHKLFKCHLISDVNSIEDWSRWSLKVPSKSNHSVIL